MIPHYSIAILTTEHANVNDLRVSELANGIIRAQREEIAEMEWLIADIAANGEATRPADADARAAPDLHERQHPPGVPERCAAQLRRYRLIRRARSASTAGGTGIPGAVDRRDAILRRRTTKGPFRRDRVRQLAG